MTTTLKLTQKRLRELLHYDPETGVFTRLIRTTNSVHVGDVVGCPNSEGYLLTRIFGGNYKLHRLAWLYMTGKWPKDETDHKNTIRTDNRWENLRESTKTINMHNRRKAHKNNKTGFLGVSPHGNGFRAGIRLDGKRKNLGTYPTPELAHQVYLDAKRELHEGCTL